MQEEKIFFEAELERKRKVQEEILKKREAARIEEEMR
jgi:hypothetical protein